MEAHIAIFGPYVQSSRNIFGDNYKHVPDGTPVFNTVGHLRTSSGVTDLEIILEAAGHKLSWSRPETLVIPATAIRTIENSAKLNNDLRELMQICGEPGNEKLIYAAATAGYHLILREC